MCVCIAFDEHFSGCAPFCRGQSGACDVHLVRLIHDMCGPNIRALALSIYWLRGNMQVVGVFVCLCNIMHYFVF